MKADNERRNDPIIRAEITKAYSERRDALVKALPLLDEACKMLIEVPYFDSVPGELYEHRVMELYWLVYRLSNDVGFIPTETYIGNEAAFELGAEIAKTLREKEVGNE